MNLVRSIRTQSVEEHKMIVPSVTYISVMEDISETISIHVYDVKDEKVTKHEVSILAAIQEAREEIHRSKQCVGEFFFEGFFTLAKRNSPSSFINRDTDWCLYHCRKDVDWKSNGCPSRFCIRIR